MTRSQHRRGERGAVAILTAILALAMFGMAALVVDLGYGRVQQRATQNAADASALAGGNVLFKANPLSPDYATAQAAVKAYAAKNLGITEAEWSSCTDAGRLATSLASPCISFNATASVAQVRVKIPSRDIGTTFAKVIGVNSINVSAFARSTLKRGGASECGLCVLGGNNMLHDIQNGDVTVTGASIHFNGNVSVSSNGLVATTGGITVQGTATGPMSSYSPDPSVGVPPITDPLADFLAQPDMSSLTAKTDPCTPGPGISGGINFSNGLCTLQPGTYVGLGQWSFSGNASLAGTGVTLFFGCGTTTSPRACNAPGEAGGQLDFSGNGTMTITAPTSGPLKGMAVWYDRLNTSELRMTGNGANTYSGSIYASSAKYRFNGNGCGFPQEALIIVRTLELNGTNACLTSNYTQSKNVDIPPGALHLDQ